jgi:hypothetical protein
LPRGELCPGPVLLRNSGAWQVKPSPGSRVQLVEEVVPLELPEKACTKAIVLNLRVSEVIFDPLLNVFSGWLEDHLLEVRLEQGRTLWVVFGIIDEEFHKVACTCASASSTVRDSASGVGGTYHQLLSVSPHAA